MRSGGSGSRNARGAASPRLSQQCALRAISATRTAYEPANHRARASAGRRLLSSRMHGLSMQIENASRHDRSTHPSTASLHANRRDGAARIAARTPSGRPSGTTARVYGPRPRQRSRISGPCRMPTSARSPTRSACSQISSSASTARARGRSATTRSRSGSVADRKRDRGLHHRKPGPCTAGAGGASSSSASARA